MTEREKILGRIREALKSKAPMPGSRERSRRMPEPPAGGARRWLPPVGDNFKDWVELFEQKRRRSEDRISPDHFQRRNAPGAGRFAGRGRLEIAPPVTPACCRMPSARRWACQMVQTDKLYDVHALEACDVGITECDALIAQTGSVVLTSRRAGGRALSILPPHHVVLARRDQFVPDLPAAFELLKMPNTRIIFRA